MLSDTLHTRTGLSNSPKCGCTLFLGYPDVSFWRDMLADTSLRSHSPSLGLRHSTTLKRTGWGLNSRDFITAPMLLEGMVVPAFYGFYQVIFTTIFRNRKEVSLYSFFRWGNWGTEALRSCVRSPSQYNILMLGPGPSHSAIAPGKALDNKQNSWANTDHQAPNWRSSN